MSAKARFSDFCFACFVVVFDRYVRWEELIGGWAGDLVGTPACGEVHLTPGEVKIDLL